MTIVSYFAYFVQDYRPRARPEVDAHKQPLLLRGLKVSVKEEKDKSGTMWCAIWPPPGYAVEPGYPELWVPKSVLEAQAEPDVPGAPSDVDLAEAVEACRVILRYLRG